MLVIYCKVFTMTSRYEYVSIVLCVHFIANNFVDPFFIGKPTILCHFAISPLSSVVI